MMLVRICLFLFCFVLVGGVRSKTLSHVDISALETCVIHTPDNFDFYRPFCRVLIFWCVTGEGGEEVERGAVGSEEKDDGGEAASC